MDGDVDGGELRRAVIGCFYSVLTALGSGLQESVYAHAMRVELSYRSIPFQAEVPYRVVHRGIEVGLYRADLVVAGTLLVEIKAVDKLVPAHFTQTINYLRVAKLPVALLMNFAPRPQFHKIALAR